MTDSIERIAGEMAACIDHGNGSLTVNSSRVIDWRDRLRALSPAGGDVWEVEAGGSAEHPQYWLHRNGRAFFNFGYGEDAELLAKSMARALNRLTASTKQSPAWGDWVMVPREPTKEMRAAGERERISRPTNMNPYHVWAAMLAASPQQEPGAAELRLFDSQWVNIVNHANCYAGWAMEEAIAHAVKLTEQAMAKNVRDGKFPQKEPSGQTLAGTGGDGCGEALAWMHEDDASRVISARQKSQAIKDGGASASSVAPYTIALTATSAGTTGDGEKWIPDEMDVDNTMLQVRYGIDYMMGWNECRDSFLLASRRAREVG